MSPTPQEYNKMSQKAAPNSKLWRNMLVAFLIGGLICTIGQGIMSWMPVPGTEPGGRRRCYLHLPNLFKRAAHRAKLL